MDANDEIAALLRKRYEGDDRAYRDVCDYIAGLRKPRTETLIRIIATGAGRTEKEVREVCRIFELHGLGRLVIGRGGRETRFAWGMAPRSIGQAARGAEAVVEQLGDVEDDHAPEAQEPQGAWIAKYPLRPDFISAITVPRDMTVEEAARLADHVRTIHVAGQPVVERQDARPESPPQADGIATAETAS